MKDIAFREKELNVWIDALPHARVVRLAGVGHCVQEEAPRDAIMQVIADFAAYPDWARSHGLPID